MMDSKASVLKSLISFILFTIAYIITICLHPNISKISNNYDGIVANSVNYTTELKTYRGFLIALSIIIGLGWLVSISNSRSIIEYNLFEDDDLLDEIENTESK